MQWKSLRPNDHNYFYICTVVSTVILYSLHTTSGKGLDQERLKYVEQCVSSMTQEAAVTDLKEKLEADPEVYKEMAV